MKVWLDILELVTMILLIFTIIVGAALLAAYLLSRLLGVL